MKIWYHHLEVSYTRESLNFESIILTIFIFLILAWLSIRLSLKLKDDSWEHLVFYKKSNRLKTHYYISSTAKRLATCVEVWDFKNDF